MTELDQLKTMFIASMSHELRTPLNSIIGFSGLIVGGMVGEISEEQRDMLNRVFRAGKHLLALITDVIDIAKLESGKILPHAEDFELADLVREGMEQVEVQARDKGLELRCVLPESAVAMQTDRRRLMQCLLNYLSNAIKFSEQGEVLVEAMAGDGEEGPWLELRVTDQGFGISAEDQRRLFGSFVRLDHPSQATIPGTGLGLYLTKKLVCEIMGGTVGLESEPGQGSSFWLRIPRKLPEQQGVTDP